MCYNYTYEMRYALMLENIDAVLFDLDGTLVDSMWIWKDIDTAYLAGFGISAE